jgi:hypothetical protein
MVKAKDIAIDLACILTGGLLGIIGAIAWAEHKRQQYQRNRP